MDTQAAAVSPAVPASLETQQERTAFPLAALTVFAIGILTAIFPMPVIQQLAFVCSASTTQLETCVRDVPMAFSEMLLLQKIVQVCGKSLQVNTDHNLFSFIFLVCDCDPTGSTDSSCDHQTGACVCLEYVTGGRCEHCSPGYYGFNSGTGCVTCNCNLEGSVDTQCDPETGQCSCKPGVSGQLCDECATGFFGFSQNGCQGR